MLTASEIESLRQDAVMSAAYFKKEFAKMPRLLTPEELAALKDDEENEVDKPE